MNRNALIALPLFAALALTACNKKPTGEETQVSVNVESDGGTTTASSADGKVRINAPGMNLEVDNPGINLKSDDFDIDGVKLYPGSAIKTMNVDAVDKAGKKDASVKVGFESPTDAKTLADWFEAEMKKEKFTLTRSGYTLKGTTDDGHPFTLTIADLGGGKASGTVVITDKD